MAKIYGVLEKAGIEQIAGDPSSPWFSGRIWVNTTAGVLKYGSSTVAARFVPHLSSGTLGSNKLAVVNSNFEISADINATTTGTLSVNNATASTSTSTGAITTQGGVGVALNAWIGGTVFANILSSKTASDDVTVQINASQHTKFRKEGSLLFPQSITSSPTSPTEGEMYWNASSNRFYYYDGSVWAELGSSSSSISSGYNYVTNPQAVSGTDGWAAYADAAGEAPVDGTGGSGSLSFVQGTNSAFYSGKTFSLSSPNTINTQGEGISYAFTIYTMDRSKVFTIEFDYVHNANFVGSSSPASPSSFVVYIYDVTNAQLIQPVSHLLDHGTIDTSLTGIANKYKGTFQTASNSSSYRLIVHCATSSTSLINLAISNVFVGPRSASSGLVVGDWQEFTMTIDGSTSNPTKGTMLFEKAFWRRVGDSMEIKYSMRQNGAGSAGSGTYLLKLPTGYSIDTAKIESSFSSTRPVVGSCVFSDTTDTYYGSCSVYNATSLQCVGTDETTGAVFDSSTTPLSDSAVACSFSAIVPIAGWSSSVLLSSETDTRVVAAAASSNNGQTLASGDVINFEDVSLDTHGAITTGVGTWKFTCPVAGVYRVEACFYNNTAGQRGLKIQKNGTGVIFTFSTATMSNVASGLIYCNAGDYLNCVQTAGSTTLETDGTNNYISIERLSGPTAIAASELIAARACGGPVTGTLNSSFNPITFTSETFDTHGVFDGTTFTCPVAGKYRVSAQIGVAGTFTSSQFVECSIHKNGTEIATHQERSDGVATYYEAEVSDILNCNAGDAITIQGKCTGSGLTFSSSAAHSFVSIERIGGIG